MLYANGEFKYTDGIIVGCSVLFGTVITNLPLDVTASLPGLLKPLLGNGFVMGILFAFILEHMIYNKKINLKSAAESSIGLTVGPTTT